MLQARKCRSGTWRHLQALRCALLKIDIPVSQKLEQFVRSFAIKARHLSSNHRLRLALRLQQRPTPNRRPIPAWADTEPTLERQTECCFGLIADRVCDRGEGGSLAFKRVAGDRGRSRRTDSRRHCHCRVVGPDGAREVEWSGARHLNEIARKAKRSGRSGRDQSNPARMKS